MLRAAVVSFLADATKDAIADEAAQRQLALALQNTTGATDDQVSRSEVTSLILPAATGVTDDELRPAMANLVRATGDVTEAQESDDDCNGHCTARGSPSRTGHSRHWQSCPGECWCVGSDGNPGEGCGPADSGLRRGDRRCERDDGWGYC